MERIWNFKRFVDRKPEDIDAAKVKEHPSMWEFIEIGASLDQAPVQVLKALNSASLQVEKKLIGTDDFQSILRDVQEGAEMFEQLTNLRKTLTGKGYPITGQIALSFSETSSVPWLNARLYRQLKLSAEEQNAVRLAAL